MSYDMQMARGDSGGLNLAIGEPFFLHTINDANSLANIGKIDLTYPPANGVKELVTWLEAKHQADTGRRCYAVVCNGAKGAIQASLYALKKKYPQKYIVTTDTPYWPSLPTLAENVGMSWRGNQPVTKTENDTLSVKILTLPNNPDGMFAFDKNQSVLLNDVDIFDGVYNHEIYLPRRHKKVRPNSTVYIDSMSKSYGLSGLRVGWLLTEDEEIAKSAAYWVEITSSGVSSIAQYAALKMLKRMDGEFGEKPIFISFARKCLETNADIFNDRFRPYVDVVHGVPNDDGGMFAWFRVAIGSEEIWGKALRTTGIKLVTGDACGMSQENGTYYRMSLGQTPKTFDSTTQLLLDTLQMLS